MAFKAPTTTFQDAIELPVPLRGDIKTYRIESVSIETGQYVQEVMTLMQLAAQGTEIGEEQQKKLHLDDAEEEDFKTALLGDAYYRMKEDKVSWAAMKIIINTVMIWTTQSIEAAEEFWEAHMVDGPKAPNRAARRASESKTKKQGSTAGTTKNRNK